MLNNTRIAVGQKTTLFNFEKTEKWQEFHDNGKIWIDGQVMIVPNHLKYLYDYRTNFKGYEGLAVCRVGIWSKYFNNGQIGWVLDYGDGTLGCKNKKDFPSYRKDGSVIVY